MESYKNQQFLKRDKIPKQVRAQWEKQQKFIRNKIIQYDDFGWNENNLRYVAGVDVSFSSRFKDAACAALVIWDFQTKKVVYEQCQYVILKQQYIPGFLAFRQLPPTLSLFKKLKANKPNYWPSLIMVDGNGILHKNGCGYASHLGVILNIPTIGCAKSFFDIDGLHQSEVQDYCADSLSNYGQNIIIKGKSGKQWCSAIMTDPKQGKSIFISVGTKISLKTATIFCLKMLNYQIPDPIRIADRHSRGKIKKLSQQQFHKADSYQMIYLTEGQTFQ